MGGSEDALTVILRLEVDKKAVLARVIVSKSTSINSSFRWQIVMREKETI